MAFVLMLSLVLPGADFPICTAAEEQYYPCAMYENGQYYVFWADYRYYTVDSSQSVFGARVSSNGTVIDPDGKLLYNHRAAEAPSAAYDGTNFLVVFRDSCWSSGNIRGVRVTPECDSINSFNICSAAGVQVYPDVAFDGTHYMVVWSDLRIAANSTVYASRVTQAGVVLDSLGIQMGPANGTLQKEPSIEFIGDKYFVVWGHLTAPFGVTGRMINLDGTLGDTIHVANSGAEVHSTAIAYDGNKMFVVWNEYPGLLRGQLVSTTGALIGSPFTIADNNVVVGSGSICFSGSEYFVVYGRRPGSYMELWGRKYDASANPILSPFRIADPTQNCADGYVVAGDEHYLCVWSRLLYPADIYGNLDVDVGIENNGSNVIDEVTPYTTTIINGPLMLPADKKFMVLDITGRVVEPDKLQPGIYFIMSDSSVVQKVIKVR